MTAWSPTKKIEQLSFNEHSLKRATAWTFLDTKTRLLIAAMYANQERKLDGKAFKKFADWIKKESSAWSYLRSNLRFSVAANLDLQTEDPKRAFKTMMKIYDQLVSAGFQRHNGTYLGALSFTLQHPEADQPFIDEQCERAITLFRGLKKQQYLLTNTYDYPLIVLLALSREADIDKIVDEVSLKYDALRQGNWKRGNDLQGLTHILSLDEESHDNEMIQKVNHLYEDWERIMGRVKPAYYSEIGVLAVRKAVREDLVTVQETRDHILSLKSFRWHKDLSTQIATQFIAGTDLAESPIEGHMVTTMAILQQAEMAAMMASITASTAATNSNN
ncbi:DUF4003 family protein [Alteribacter populi]|uniref:DUF4003 family protein n=1 Tax=Alteribacter populi TaxID=2011011 RepID=UPI000BBABB26|nr:DUF4003 family protein [Alteribacter populi]